MATGLPPFYTKDREKLFDRIRNQALAYPTYIADPAKELMQGLMLRDPNQRLGGGPTDSLEVQTHKFYSGFDFAACHRRELDPPFVPQLKDGDVMYVDQEFTQMPVVNSEEPGARNVAHFEGFTYG